MISHRPSVSLGRGWVRGATALLAASVATCAPPAAEPPGSAGATGVTAPDGPAAGAPLVPDGAITLAGVGGRFDHFACDPRAPRMFVAALGNDSLEVFDPTAKTRLRSITGLSSPTGVVFLPGPDRVWVAGAGDGTLRSFDAATLAAGERIDSLDDADNVRFDSTSGLVWVGYGDALAAVDPTRGRRVASIPLRGHPESFQLEPAGTRIFVNVPGSREVTVIDREQRKVIAHWPLGRFHANFPMAIDPKGPRLLVGCRTPARLVVLDAVDGSITGDVELSRDADDLFLDEKRGRLYVSCGDGQVDVFRRVDADHYQRVARIPTRGGARTCYWSPELDRLFVAVPRGSGRDAEIRVFRPQD